MSRRLVRLKGKELLFLSMATVLKRTDLDLLDRSASRVPDSR
jgi:hypothetical protein